MSLMPNNTKFFRCCCCFTALSLRSTTLIPFDCCSYVVSLLQWWEGSQRSLYLLFLFLHLSLLFPSLRKVQRQSKVSVPYERCGWGNRSAWEDSHPSGCEVRKGKIIIPPVLLVLKLSFEKDPPGTCSRPSSPPLPKEQINCREQD